MKTTAELLREYKAMLDDGTITQDEYQKIKTELLAKGNVEYKEAKDNISQKNSTSGSGTNKQMQSEGMSEESKETLSKLGCLVVIFIVVVLLFKGCAWLLSDTSDPESTLDYGKNYYYDNSTHQVERSLHGILNGAPEP